MSETAEEGRQTGQTVIACIFLILIIIVALVGNIGVILVVTLYRQMRRDISNMLLINLSVTDCLNTCSVMLSALISLIADDWVLGRVWCDIICAVNYWLIIVSMLTLCCISLERYQAIIHPLSYRSKVKRVTLFLAICYTWVQGAVFALIPSVLGWVDFDYWEAICAIQWHLYRPGTVIYVITAFALCFLGPGIILCYCYVKIIKEVRKQKDLVIVGLDTEKYKRRKLSDKARIIWSLLVVVFAYFICTTPFSLTKLIKVFISDTSMLPGEVNLSAALLGYMASAINPLIYGIFRKDFRKAYFQILKKIFLNESLRRHQDIVTDASPSQHSGGQTHNSDQHVNRHTDTSSLEDNTDKDTILDHKETSPEDQGISNNVATISDKTTHNHPTWNGHGLRQEPNVDINTSPNPDEMMTYSVPIICHYKQEVKQCTPIQVKGCICDSLEVKNKIGNLFKNDTLIAEFDQVFQENRKHVGWKTWSGNQLHKSLCKSTSLNDFQNQGEISAESITPVIT